MSDKKNLGIWMDHSNAHIMEFSNETINSTFIDSINLKSEKQHTLGAGESQQHNKEQRHQSAYYHKLIDEIKNYDNVLLFGPTGAKVELFNLIKADHKYAKINIEVKTSDKMSEHQQHAFVKEYFSKN